MKVKVDASRLVAKLRAADAARPAARVSGIRIIGQAIVEAMSVLSPRDTNRYVRGWLQAGRKAGVSGMGLPALRPSKRRQKIIEALVEQAAKNRRWQYIKEKELSSYLAKRGGKPPGRKGEQLAAQIAAAKERVAKAEEALRKFVGNDAALAMMRKVSYTLLGNQRNISGKALNLEVKDKVYGGEGHVIDGPDRSVLQLHNLEPHSRPVENRNHVVAKANAAVRRTGLKKLRQSYINEIRSKVAAKAG